MKQLRDINSEILQEAVNVFDVKQINVREAIKAVDIKQMNVYEKLNAAIKFIGNINPELEIPTFASNNNNFKGKKSYKSLSANQVKRAVSDACSLYRIAISDVKVKLIDHKFMETQKVNKTNNQSYNVNEFYKLIEVEAYIVNMDNPSEKIYCNGFGEGIDSGDKGCGKAETYAYKHLLKKVFMLVTDDDEDPDTAPSIPQQRTFKPTQKIELDVANYSENDYITINNTKILKQKFFPLLEKKISAVTDINKWGEFHKFRVENKYLINELLVEFPEYKDSITKSIYDLEETYHQDWVAEEDLRNMKS